MFKIPTYEELEKNENAFNEKRKEFQSNLFQKRKILNDDDGKDEELKASKNQKTTSPSNNTKQTASTSAAAGGGVNLENDPDDDDLLLSEFIAQNKDIIEKPNSTNNEFKVPQIPKTTSIFLKKTTTTTTSTNKTTSTSATSKQPQVTSSGTVVGGGSSGSGGPMIVNSKQRGNPVLKHIRNVQWNFSDTLTPDYCMTRSSCALFITMKYHLLNPTYIHQRIKELGRAYDLRIMLVLCDVKEPQHCIKELEKICIFSNFVMILCWSNEEIGRYLETYKAYEFKSADAIMEKSTNSLIQTNAQQIDKNKDSNSDANFINNFTDFMCQIKSINKTDASTLRQTFGSIKNLSKSSKEELNLCPGLGSLKVKRIYDIFRTPFQMNKNKTQEEFMSKDK